MRTKYDVVVYGGTSAGVAAAVQAARMGKEVVLIDQGNLLGGLTSSGLTATDVANYMVIGGISREFYERIYRYYQSQQSWKYESHEAYMDRVKTRVWGGGDELTKMRWVFEPRVAETVFLDMVKEAGVTVVFRERLNLNHGVNKEGACIQSITMESGLTFAAKVFIDTTYEGDLMAAAGISYTVGRESNRQYGESLNGVRQTPLDKRMDPHIVRGDRSSGLLPYIERGKPGEEGEGDHRIQSYTFRLTLTDVKENQTPIEKPDHYNPLLYELKARQIQMTANPKTIAPVQHITFTPMPNRKTDTNSADFIGASHAWPGGNYSIRGRLWDEHKDYVQGLLWFLGNDPRVPEHARQEMKRWGLAADEYQNNDNWPNHLYVREARRMISDVVMTEHHLKGRESVTDSIGMCSYPADSHSVSYYVGEDGLLGKEGDIMGGVQPYSVSYRALVPSEKECTNLVVPTTPSSTHVAYASIRMEPSFMILAQAAGTIAALAIDSGSPIQRIPYPTLRNSLLKHRQILELDINQWNDMYARYLFEQKVIDSVKFWQGSETVDGNSLQPLIMNAARKFQPARDVPEALQILHDEGIQPSRTSHWTSIITSNQVIAKVSADQFMRDIARRLANYTTYPRITNHG